MERDLAELLAAKDAAHYGMDLVSAARAERMVARAARLIDGARRVVDG